MKKTMLSLTVVLFTIATLTLSSCNKKKEVLSPAVEQINNKTLIVENITFEGVPISEYVVKKQNSMLEQEMHMEINVNKGDEEGSSRLFRESADNWNSEELSISQTESSDIVYITFIDHYSNYVCGSEDYYNLDVKFRNILSDDWKDDEVNWFLKTSKFSGRYKVEITKERIFLRGETLAGEVAIELETKK